MLVGFIQIINELPTLFHPPEYVGADRDRAAPRRHARHRRGRARRSISAGIGLDGLLDRRSIRSPGSFRYTFNAVGLYGGVSLVALALGLFAIPQMILVFGTATTIARQDMTGREVEPRRTPSSSARASAGRSVRGMAETFRHWVAARPRRRSIGVVTGIIPGIGGFAANFLSYGVAQQ